jgi:3-methylfumaryl-CoA hydratase
MAPENAERFAAVLDEPRAFRSGDEVPLLWHWAYFAEIVGQSELGADGHPRRGSALAERFPHRMAASGSVDRVGPLCVGRPATRHSYLEETTEKHGRTGPLLFAVWRHSIEQDGRTVLEERQTLVYRPSLAGAPGGGSYPREPGRDGVIGPGYSLRRTLTFDAALLFRFSAATWNAHRIHYDHPYATRSEGFPGLVVHGPLVAAELALEASREIGKLAHIEFRVRAPVFVDDRIEAFGQKSGRSRFSAEAWRADGTLAMSLDAEAEH